MRLCVRCGAAEVGDGWRCAACGHEPERRDGIALLAPDAIDPTHSFDPALFESLAALEERSFWFIARNELLMQTMRTHFPGAETMLEVGCGTGYVLRMLVEGLGLRAVGCELFPEGLAYARERLPSVELLQLDATRLPFAAEFDVVGAFDVLEHIEDDEAVLANAHEALKPGGGLVVTVPQHRWLWSQADEDAFHVRRYRRGELVGRAEAAGFRVRQVTSFVSVLLPLMAASRLKERVLRRDYDFQAEAQPSPRVSDMLLRALRAERRVLGRGRSLPAGGSLLLVAERV